MFRGRHTVQPNWGLLASMPTCFIRQPVDIVRARPSAYRARSTERPRLRARRSAECTAGACCAAMTSPRREARSQSRRGARAVPALQLRQQRRGGLLLRRTYGRMWPHRLVDAMGRLPLAAATRTRTGRIRPARTRTPARARRGKRSRISSAAAATRSRSPNMTTLTSPRARAGTRLSTATRSSSPSSITTRHRPVVRQLAKSAADHRAVRFDPDRPARHARPRRRLGPRPSCSRIAPASNLLGNGRSTDVRRAAYLAHARVRWCLSMRHYAARAGRRARLSARTSSAAPRTSFYGPHVGVLCGRQARSSSSSAAARASPATARAAETGTQNHEAVVGAAAAVAFLLRRSPTSRAALPLQAVSRRCTRAARQLWRAPVVRLPRAPMSRSMPTAARAAHS